MKTLRILFVLSLFSFVFTTNAQLKVFNNGAVRINTYAGNWARAIYTNVHNPQTCAYHLRYLNDDVFYVCAEGWLWSKEGGYCGSDFRQKRNLKKLSSPLSTIKKLNGVQFDYCDTMNNRDYNDYKYNSLQTTKSNKQRIGLIAQEVEEIMPGIVKTLPDSTKAIAYTDLIPLLIEAMKEQQKQIETLNTLVYSQEQDIIELRNNYESCCLSDSNKKSNFKNSSLNESPTSKKDNKLDVVAKLYQNSPNPFSSDTKIKFFIPKSSGTAKLIIHDMQGLEIKSFEIMQTGLSNKTINGSALKPGMYLYTLLLDNEIIDTKRMLLTKD